ncbi:hypothetical protein BpHYR1_033746 [Brachionus plicatilis]|uniref:Uncharacterized protein n=1 Tax=Brachionus plicatilis TaxID=10195 RepID=A0A3M7T242_BRAPC|nr:hypothetical protein BpHYR1_033746 [Brachionus plicatilis]
MDISTKCRTRKLFHAMNIEPTEHKIKLIKLDFFFRLDSSRLTSELIKYMGDIDIKDEIVSEIFEMTEILNFGTSVTIQEACAGKIYIIKDEIRCEREGEQICMQIVFEKKINFFVNLDPYNKQYLTQI